MDLFIESMDRDLSGAVIDAGIEVLGLFSENLGRLAGFAVENWTEREAIADVIKGNKELDDFIGSALGDTVMAELRY